MSQLLCVRQPLPSQVICAGNGHLLRVGPFIIVRRYSYERRSLPPTAPVAARRLPIRCVLYLHTGAYWLMLKLRDAIPRPQPLATAEFTTLRMRLIKIAARIVETASRVRLAFAAAHPEAALFASLARSLQPAGP